MSHSESEVEQELLAAVAASRGHFVYESGHHGDLWLELDRLFFDAPAVQRLVARLAERTENFGADVMCGPLVGGAFVANALAALTGKRFAFTSAAPRRDGTTDYEVPAGLRSRLTGARVLVVDDVTNVGSAARATADAVTRAGATVVGFGALMTLGNAGPRLREDYGVPFASLCVTERRLWPPHLCVLCEHGVPITDNDASVTGLLSDDTLR